MMKKLLAMVLACGLGVLATSSGWGAPTAINKSFTRTFQKVGSSEVASEQPFNVDEIVRRLNADIATLERIVPLYAEELRQEAKQKDPLKLRMSPVEKAPATTVIRSPLKRFTSFLGDLFKKAPATPSLTAKIVPTKMAPMRTALDRDRLEILRAVLGIVGVTKQIRANQLTTQIGDSASPFLSEFATRALLYALWGNTVLRTGAFGGRINPDSPVFADRDGWIHDRDMPDLLAGKLPLKLSLSLLENQKLSDRNMANHAEQNAAWKASYTYFFSQHDLLWWDFGLTEGFDDLARLMNGAEPALFKTFYKYMLAQMFLAHDGARSDTKRQWSSRLLLYKDNGENRNFAAGRDNGGAARYLFQTVGGLYNTNGFGIYLLNPYFRLTKVSVGFDDVVALRMLDHMNEPTPCSDLTDLGLPSSGAPSGTDTGLPSGGGMAPRCGGRSTSSGAGGGPASSPNFLGNQMMMGGCLTDPLPTQAGTTAPGVSAGGFRECSSYDGFTLSAAIGGVRAPDPSCVNTTGGEDEGTTKKPGDPPAPPTSTPPPPSGGTTSSEAEAEADVEEATAALNAAQAQLTVAETAMINAVLYTEPGSQERADAELNLLAAAEEFDGAELHLSIVQERLDRIREGGGSRLCGDEGCSASSTCSRVDQQALAFNGCNPTSSSATDTGAGATFCPDGGMCAGMPGSGHCGNDAADPTNPACDPMIAASSAMNSGCGSASSTPAAGFQPLTKDGMHQFINQYGNPGPEGAAGGLPVGVGVSGPGAPGGPEPGSPEGNQ